MTGEKKKEIWRVVKFVLFSASAGIIQIGLFTLLNELCKWSYWPCYLIALVASVVWNFTLNRKFTFQSANNVPKAMAMVLGYYAVFTPLSTILGNWLLSVTANKYVFLFAVNIIILILGSNPAKEDSLSVQFKSTSCIIRSAVKCIIFRCDPWTF